MNSPTLLVSDRSKTMFDLPGYQACGQSGQEVVCLSSDDLIPLPKGSQLFFLPNRRPVAFNETTRHMETLEGFSPVSAFLPAGYTNLYSAAYREATGARLLPLFSYAPVAFYRSKLHVPAVLVDRRKKHDLTCVDQKLLERRMQPFRKTSNRLIRHLADCALINSCPNAINFFLGKHECPLPVSPSCNAGCLGCISYQPKDSCPATQPRLTFVPTPEEIAEVAFTHLRQARLPIVSFGQGCEGEPLLKAGVISEAIRIIRRETARGTIHMNTNGSLTAEVEELCSVGLDSLRVSLNSAQKKFYDRYYSPRGYSFTAVKASIRVAKKLSKFVSLNYLVLPGFTDRKDEFDALASLVRETHVDMIQWRNLNYDPQAYFRKLQVQDNQERLGIKRVMSRLRALFPRLSFGYFNVPL